MTECATVINMDYRKTRKLISSQTGDISTNSRLLMSAGIDTTEDGSFKVRADGKTPSYKINKDGSFHDYGSGEHYSDIVSLLYDGYQAFGLLLRQCNGYAVRTRHRMGGV